MLRTLIAVIRIPTEEWMVKRTVDALQDLDDRTLKDIGITRSEVESPARWRRRNLLTMGTVHTELPPGQRIADPPANPTTRMARRRESPTPVNGRR